MRYNIQLNIFNLKKTILSKILNRRERVTVHLRL